MPSQYLLSDDYETYQIPANQDALVMQASALIDAYLQRPEGLIWEPDAAGQPCYMSALDSPLALTLSAPIAPGTNVVATVTGPINSIDVGKVLILDRADTNTTEACVVVSQDNGTVTLDTVMYDHGANALLEYGLVIEEERPMPNGRPKTRVSRTPAMRLIACAGRYGYGRRSLSNDYELEEFNLLASMSRFGGPPIWEPFPTTNVMTVEGDIWAPAGMLMSYFTKVRLQYVAGFPSTAIPAPIKQACADLVSALTQAGVAPMFKTYKAGDTQMALFTASMLSADLKRMINPYKVQPFA